MDYTTRSVYIIKEMTGLKRTQNNNQIIGNDNSLMTDIVNIDESLIVAHSFFTQFAL